MNQNTQAVTLSTTGRAILALSSGTIASMIAMSRYEDIDEFQQAWALWESAQERSAAIQWQASFSQYAAFTRLSVSAG